MKYSNYWYFPVHVWGDFHNSMLVSFFLGGGRAIFGVPVFRVDEVPGAKVAKDMNVNNKISWYIAYRIHGISLFSNGKIHGKALFT